MTRMFFAVLVVALAGVACDSVGIGGSRERVDPEEREARARKHEAEYKRAFETVQTHRAWQTRIQAEDLAPMHLPPAGEGDDAFRPVIGDPTFCDRLPDQPIPAPGVLVAEYRRHTEVYDDSSSIEGFADYRANYLAERHMSRLGCLVVAGGPEHRRAFRALLRDDNMTVFITVAIHAVNHGWAPDAGRENLRQLADCGCWGFSEETIEALYAGTPPIDALLHTPNFRLDFDLEVLRRMSNRRWVSRTGMGIRY